jgi:hypothetical protein
MPARLPERTWRVEDTGLALRRPTALELLADRVILGRRFVLRAGMAAELRRWRQPATWVTLGLAVALRTDQGKLTLAARNHLVPAKRPRISVTDRVSASLEPQDFDELLAALGLSNLLEPDATLGAWAFDLAPRPGTAALAWRTILPMAVAIAGLAAVALIQGALGGVSSPLLTDAAIAIDVLLVAAGLIATIRRAMRGPVVQQQIVLRNNGMISLVDAGSGAILETAAASSLTIAQRHFQLQARGSVDFPMLELGWPSGASLRIGVWDPSCMWPGPTSRSRLLEWVIGVAEWKTLLGVLQPNR